MEKKIILAMKPNKDIVVTVNGKDKMTIESHSRNVDANVIYELLNYSKDDTYLVETSNESNVDISVLNFFANLIKNIVAKLNPND